MSLLCGRYQDYTCQDMNDPETGENIEAEELACKADPEMQIVAQTHAAWCAASLTYLLTHSTHSLTHLLTHSRTHVRTHARRMVRRT